MLSNDPPAPDVVEVSIFGPGKGECILVHLGHGKWIVVDSCVDQQDNSIPVIEYLKHLNVSIESDVLMILGTHAHDDHIAGISRVLNECTSAFFGCSSALIGEDFISVLEQDYQAELNLRKSAYSEFRKVQEIANSRHKANQGRRYMRRVVEDYPLINLEWPNGFKSTVTALSPSHEAVTRALRNLAKVTVDVGKPRRPFRGDPNECSVALWIEALDKRILLGADLLKGPSGCGWAGILSSFKPSECASLFKVPHHGAPNADEVKVWDQLLVPESPVALLAPFRGGHRARPDAADRARITARTRHAFITASPDVPAPGKVTRRRKAELGHLAVNAREPWGRVGQVRARSQLGEVEWKIDLLPPARTLQASGRRR
jgi:hypothetical protein